MVEWKYMKFQKSEIFDIIFIGVVLSILFSITFFRFTQSHDYEFFGIFITFFIFLEILIFLRTFVMKLAGYFNAFEVYLYQTYFDRFWLKKWDRLSYYEKVGENIVLKEKKTGFKGIPMSIISVLIYILTLGFIVFPSIWNFKYKKIPHLHLGTQQRFEYQLPHLFNRDISDYRFSKAFFSGFVFYFIFGLLMKTLLNTSHLYYWFIFILSWIAFVTIIPILGTEGYELFARNRFAWISAFTILILGMLSLVVFRTFSYTVMITIFSTSIVIFVAFYKKVLNE